MACCGPESWIRSAMYLQNVNIGFTLYIYMIYMQGFHFVFEQQMNHESQQMARGPHRSPCGSGQIPPEAPSISAFEWASGACIFTYFCIHFYMHNSIIMCQRDSTKNYKKKSSTCTPRCLKQVRSAPCGRIELGHVKQVNPSTKRHIKTTVKNNTRLTKTR